MSKTFRINNVEEHLENFSKSNFSSLRFELRGFQFERDYEMYNNVRSRDARSNSFRTTCF